MHVFIQFSLAAVLIQKGLWEVILMLELVYVTVSVEKIIDLRHRVLREGLPRTTAYFSADDDLDTSHFAVFLAGETENPICCASFMSNPFKGQSAWQLRGMATMPQYQGKGVGQQLLIFCEATLLKRSGAKPLWCNARLPAVGFYEKQGWRCVSDIFEIPTAGLHRQMVKQL